jgi:phosphatidylserine decarboxylase
VHVNRIPVTGIVTKTSYRPGKFINASLDKSSKDNERQSVLINTVDGREVGLVQIAGLIARRIVCNVKDGDQVKAGSRYGIIKFGSRVDVFLPEGVEPAVLVGQTMVGGETVIARLNGEQKMITGTTE